MRRVCRLEGQLPMLFELEVKPVEAGTAQAVATEPVPVPTKALKPIKVRTNNPKAIFHHDKPSVTFHKAGRKLLVKANDPIAADAWEDVRQRAAVDLMGNVKYFTGVPGEDINKEEAKKIELWKHLENGVDTHPFAEILRSYGVEVFISPSLSNFMKKERRRQDIENTPFPVNQVTPDVKLFDRCCEGAVLRCLRDFIRKGVAGAQDTVLFKKGERYMVMSTGGEGKDHVVLSTEPVKDKVTLSMSSTSKMYEWTGFDPEMEEWFDDSEEMDSGKDIVAKYPDLIAAAQSKLDKSGLKDTLYEHVQEDVVRMALKRGGINAYLMRMAKTSFLTEI